MAQSLWRHDFATLCHGVMQFSGKMYRQKLYDEGYCLNATINMVPTVRGSQGKSGKIQMVRGSQRIQKYHGAKVNKDAEKNRTVARTLHTALCGIR